MHLVAHYHTVIPAGQIYCAIVICVVIECVVAIPRGHNITVYLYLNGIGSVYGKTPCALFRSRHIHPSAEIISDVGLARFRRYVISVRNSDDNRLL